MLQSRFILLLTRSSRRWGKVVGPMLDKRVRMGAIVWIYNAHRGVDHKGPRVAGRSIDRGICWIDWPSHSGRARWRSHRRTYKSWISTANPASATLNAAAKHLQSIVHRNLRNPQYLGAKPPNPRSRKLLVAALNTSLTWLSSLFGFVVSTGKGLHVDVVTGMTHYWRSRWDGSNLRVIEVAR